MTVSAFEIRSREVFCSAISLCILFSCLISVVFVAGMPLHNNAFQAPWWNGLGRGGPNPYDLELRNRTVTEVRDPYAGTIKRDATRSVQPASEKEDLSAIAG